MILFYVTFLSQPVGPLVACMLEHYSESSQLYILNLYINPVVAGMSSLSGKSIKEISQLLDEYGIKHGPIVGMS